MIVSRKCFEQYCIHKKRNVNIEEILFNNGKREYICRQSSECKKCENHIIPYEINMLKNC